MLKLLSVRRYHDECVGINLRGDFDLICDKFQQIPFLNKLWSLIFHMYQYILLTTGAFHDTFCNCKNSLKL